MSTDRLPSISVEDRRLQIAQFLRNKARPQEMLRYFLKEGHTDIKAQDIYNDIRWLNEQVKDWYWKQAKGDLLASHKLSIEVLEERQRKLMLIESDANLEPRDRIAASIAIAEIEVAIHNWLPYTQALMETAVKPKPATERSLEENPS